MKFTFNTGRPYTEQGQVIRVEVADGRVWFHDESRMIAGSIDSRYPTLSEGEAKEAVTFCYDRGLYRGELVPPQGEARRRD